MFQRFIVATDLSPASFAVANSLRGLQAYGAEQCLLLQCLSLRGAVSAAYSSHAEFMDEMLGKQRDLLEKQGFAVEARTITGSAKQEINRIAVEEQYALIVVGTQGESLTRERLLGGVAYGIINTSKKPVLVMPVAMVSDDTDTSVLLTRYDFSEHIVLATDFSEMAYKAFLHVEQMVARGVRKITLVHVQDKNDLKHHLKKRSAAINALDRSRLENLQQTLLAQGRAQVDIAICHGEPFVEITRLAREGNAHLVVMGTQGRSFFGEIFLGSVSHNVARTSIAPVLLIPPVP